MTSAGTETGATAVAHPNIALAKYWGKQDRVGNIPAVPSLSITLDSIATTTTVTFGVDMDRDQLHLNGVAASGKTLARVSACLDEVRQLGGDGRRARVETRNNFPTGAGLASSASGFAALTTAAAAALRLQASAADLSAIARAASASAARSMFGGFAILDPDGDGRAAPLLPAAQWPLQVVVAVCDEREKSTGSSDGMRLSARTSPYYDAWVGSSRDDFRAAHAAVLGRDFERLAEVAEHSCLKMHALMQSTRPALLYWNAATHEAVAAVRAMRSAGVEVFFTIDAGPQVKAVCSPAALTAVQAGLAAVPGVMRLITTGLGPGAHCV